MAFHVAHHMSYRSSTKKRSPTNDAQAPELTAQRQSWPLLPRVAALSPSPLSLNRQISHAKTPHHARVTTSKTKRVTAPAMCPALRLLPSCAPINRDHAREHERKSEFCFEVGNEMRNPRRCGHVPIKCRGVACTQVAKKPTHKPSYVNSPADTFRFCHPT